MGRHKSEKMGKKTSRAFLILGIVSVLTACGADKGASETTSQDLNIKIDVPEKAEQSNEKRETQEMSKEAEGAFRFSYEGTTLTPGEMFDASMLKEYKKLSTVPSCAFDGKDNVYNYGTFELTAHIEEDKERIYSIYLIDSNLSTTEGLSLGDTLDDVKSVYGEDYKEEETSYIYTRGETSLIMIVQDNVVVSIEYRLVR